MPFDRLAFIDLETSGPSASADRITEIGVVLHDRSGVRQWSSLLDAEGTRSERPWRRPKYAGSNESRPPRFSDVAATLATLLQGRLVVAHNARFDLNFLRAEFARAGLNFEPTVLCSLLLSRKLYPEHACHDLDSIAQRHGLITSVRHRALPDAYLLKQFWDAIHASHDALAIESLIAQSIAAPIYPAHLDLAAVERLPDAAGVYLLMAEDGKILDAAAASNIKRHVQNYFRLGGASARAFAFSHRVADIRWHTTRGPIGARLRLAAMSEHRSLRGRDGVRFYCWRLAPSNIPAVDVAAFDSELLASGEAYGMFRSVERARNALARLAREHGLCHHMLGLVESRYPSCPRCATASARPLCMSAAGRLRELTRIVLALSSHRNPAWPFDGPVGIRERGEIHVLDRWCYLGSAADEAELRSLLRSRTPYLDKDTYMLTRRLIRRSANRLTPLHAWAAEKNSAPAPS